MVETGGLENRCARKGTGGSNPSLSAIPSSKKDLAVQSSVEIGSGLTFPNSASDHAGVMTTFQLER